MKRTAVAIRHVGFEDLGLLAPLLDARGFSVTYLEASTASAFTAAEAADLVIVLGGPIGAYEEASYPFLKAELQILEQRLSRERPTLGICLGAQLMARALGAPVYPGPHKEIGWSALTLSLAGQASCLAALEEAPVLHWHGDTFDVPEEAILLASSSLYANQAFAFGKRALALQFHLEADVRGIECWYVGHACELAAAKISVVELREQGLRHAAVLQTRARRCFDAWLTSACG
jgi:GMP synthase (glutamine-hydrolysing)